MNAPDEVVAAPIEACIVCGEKRRLPTLTARRNFERRGNRCLQCATDPEELEALLNEMLAATDWTKITLAAKLAIAAEVAR